LQVLGWFEQQDRLVAIEDPAGAAQQAQLLGNSRSVAAAVQFSAGTMTQRDVRDNAPAPAGRSSTPVRTSVSSAAFSV
jgi:hypothetical protein